MSSQADHGDDNGARVEFTVPDDARELDRDVQAYYRELRQRRRQARWQAMVRSLRRHGLVTPLGIGALLLVAIAATMMTALAPGTTNRAPPAPLASHADVAPGQVGGLLPDTRVAVSDKPTPVRALRPAVIALVPSGCACEQAADELYRQARAYSLRVYFVASRRSASELRPLIETGGHGLAVPVHDARGTLESAYRASGLTALLVRRDGVVTGVVRDLGPGLHLEQELSPLRRSP